jgi:bile acid:Na+ symporter, BASS family
VGRVIRELFFTLFWAVSLTLTLLFVVTRMLYVGLSVTPAQLADLRRHSSLLIRALLANFVIVPALGVAIAAMSWVPAPAALAMVIVALLAGGTDFFALAESSNGESRLAAPLTFVLSMVGGLLSPIVRVLIQPSGTPMMGSVWKLLAVTALAVPLPLIIGLLLRRMAPAPARVLSKATALVAVLLFVAAAAATFLVKAPLAAEIGVRGVLAMIVLLVGAGLVGSLFGGPSMQQRTLLARITMMRNVGLGLLLAIVAFPNAGVDVAIVLFVVIELALRAVWLIIGWNMVPSIPTLRSGKP